MYASKKITVICKYRVVLIYVFIIHLRVMIIIMWLYQPDGKTINWCLASV